MKITQHTKISALIKHNPKAIDAIVSINKHFEKLRNPVLRKILASRVSIADAAKIGGADIQTFFEKLVPLGFVYEQSEKPEKNMEETKEIIPEFYKKLSGDKTIELDVRPNLEKGNDPFQVIMDGISKLPDGFTLKLITTFEPKPLISILRQKGYSTYVSQEASPLVYTYFKKEANADTITMNKADETPSSEKAITDFLKNYADKIKNIDVRDLEMPLPMVTILKELEHMPEDFLLYVHHKKVPQFLLPELKERGYKWMIQEIDEGNVKLLIYK